MGQLFARGEGLEARVFPQERRGKKGKDKKEYDWHNDATI